MKTRKFTTLGAAGILAGVMLLGFAASIGSTPRVQAGEVTLSPSETRGPAKTHTPTQTSTAESTNTAVATSTPQVVNTPAPSATRPSGGNEGVSVKPPNTGSGGASGGPGIWLVALGAILVASGGGSLLYGVRRRS